LVLVLLCLVLIVLWSCAAARVLLGEVLTTVDLGLAGEPSSGPGVSQVDSEST